MGECCWLLPSLAGVLEAHREGNVPRLLQLLGESHTALSDVSVSRTSTSEALVATISLFGALMTHSDPRVVLAAAVPMNAVLRMEGAVAMFRAAGQASRGSRGDTSPSTEQAGASTDLIPSIYPATLLKTCATYLHGKRPDLQLGALACMAALLLTPPEDPRAAKLFGQTTIARAVQLCLDVLRTDANNDQSVLPPLCVHILSDLLNPKAASSATLLTHSPFVSELGTLVQAAGRSIHVARLLRRVADSAARSEAASVAQATLGSSQTARTLIAVLIQDGTAERPSPAHWRALLQLLVAVRQMSQPSDGSIGPVEEFIEATVSTLQKIPSDLAQPTVSPYAILLLTGLIREDSALRSALIDRLSPEAIQLHRQRSGRGTAATDCVLGALAASLGTKAAGIDPMGLLADAVRGLHDTRCPVLRHQCCATLFEAMHHLMLKDRSEHPKDAVLADHECLADRLASALRHKCSRFSARLSDPRPSKRGATPEADSDAESSEGSGNPRDLRIRKLESENAATLQRLTTLTGEYQALEATLGEIREWSQRVSSFDRDKLDELAALREFQAKHLSCEAVADLRTKDLEDALDRKTRKLDDTYMKLILLAKAHQKALQELETQQRQNSDLQVEIQRAGREWSASEGNHAKALAELKASLAATTHERLSHSVTASEALKGLEASVSGLRTENALLTEKLTAAKSQVQTTRAQTKHQTTPLQAAEQKAAATAKDLAHLRETTHRLEQDVARQAEAHRLLQDQHQQALAKAKDAEGRYQDQHRRGEALTAELNRVKEQLRDVDGRLQRYSSVTSLIHSLARDPENATQTTHSGPPT